MSLFLGSVYSTIELDTSKLDRQVGSAQRSFTSLQSGVSGVGDQSERSFGTMVRASALGNVAAMGFSKGIELLTGSVSGAVTRVDTLNNSARTFQNMGFDGKQVTQTMDAIKQSILGLPTSLDSAVRNVQLFAASTGDLGKSQQVFAALNNGILGFGGSAAMVDNAVVQLSQSFAGGKVDAETWNSMLDSGLGPALNAIAKDMGLTTAALKSGLSDGSISVGKFQDELIKLNTQGGGGLTSLQKIAKDSTSGISTGMQNMQTAVTRGMASILTAIGTSNISGAISGIGSAFESSLKVVASVISGTAKGVQTFVSAVKSGNPYLLTALGVITALGAPLAVYSAVLTATAAKLAINAAATATWNTITGIATGLTEAYSMGLFLMGEAMNFALGPIGLIILGIAALIAIGFLVVKNWDTISKAATTILGAAWNWIKTSLSSVGQFFVSIWQGARDAVVGAFNWIQSTVTTVWTAVTNFITTGIATIGYVFTNLPYLIGYAIGALVGFLINFVTNDIPNFVNGVISWIGQLPGKIGAFFSMMWTTAVTLVSGMISGVLGFFAALPGQIWNFAMAVFNLYVSVWSAILSFAWNTASSIVSGVINFFAQLPGRIGSFVSGVWNTVVNTFNSLRDTMGNIVSSAINNTVNFFRDLPGKIMDAISGLAGAIGNKFKSIASSAWDGFKAGLGIHSPSYIENAFTAIQNKGMSTVSDMRSNMSRLNSLATSARRYEPPFYNGNGSDFALNEAGGAAGGDTYNISLPNVQEPADFAREFKLAKQGLN